MFYIFANKYYIFICENFKIYCKIYYNHIISHQDILQMVDKNDLILIVLRYQNTIFAEDECEQYRTRGKC